MTTICTLENIKKEALLEVFNHSFSDYLIPLSITEEQLEKKIDAESIDLELSVGAFNEDKIVGFILHGYNLINNHKVLYNAGTGIIPAERGKQLTVKMYEYILPKLKSLHIRKIILEVITENKAALVNYERIGFKKVRKLNCYKGKLNSSGIETGYKIKKLDFYEWDKLISFRDSQPTWQNSNLAVEKLKQSNISIGIYQEESLLGYLIYNPASKRIQQFSIDKNYRKRGLGKSLFNFINSNYGNEVSVINVDDNDRGTNTFITSLGLKQTLNQYEMEIELESEQEILC